MQGWLIMGRTKVVMIGMTWMKRICKPSWDGGSNQMSKIIGQSQSSYFYWLVIANLLTQ